jgi:hypothetical protein
MSGTSRLNKDILKLVRVEVQRLIYTLLSAPT